MTSDGLFFNEKEMELNNNGFKIDKLYFKSIFKAFRFTFYSRRKDRRFGGFGSF